VPIIVGGGGPKRTPALAAKYAAEFNLPFQSMEFYGTQTARVREACEKIGRDPKSLVYSTAQVVCVGKNDADIARRAAAIGREVDELRQNGLCGTPAQVVEKILTWDSVGAQRLYLQMLNVTDLEHLDLIGEEVLPFV
jgi:alkanesulfonate monooxygenase